MPARPEQLIWHLRRLITPVESNQTPDDALLSRFVHHGDEQAFTTLVARHGPMVLGLCRRVLGNTQDAEDTFQATFLVLARKAASLRDPAALAAWLHGVAYRLASKARAGIDRRRQREATPLVTPPADPHADPLADLSARELLSILDAELQRLPQAVRLPLVLCYLEGVTQEQAAQRLGCTPDAVRGRLQRGRARLAARLTRRGLTLPAALLAAKIADGMATAAVPPTLAVSTAHAAVAFAAGAASVSSGVSKAVALAEHSLRGMALAKVKLGVVFLLTTSLAVAGVGKLTSPQADQRQTPPHSAARRVDAPKPEPDTTVRLDSYGDPLPPGALTRMGTVRFRHGSLVSSVVFSRDGKIVASGSYDNTVRLWEPLTGKELHWFPKRKINQVWSIALSPDGKTVCVGSVNHFLDLYSLSTGDVIRQFGFADRMGGFNSVAFSPDGKILAGGSITRKVGLWDVATGELRHELQGHQDRVTSVRFSPDGKLVASGSHDRTIRLWEMATGKELRQFVGHEDKVNSVAFSPAGQWVASGGDDRTVRFWEVSTGKEIRRLKELPGLVRCVDFSPKGTTLATGIRPGALNEACDVQLWEVATGKELTRFRGPRWSVEALAFSPDGRFLVAGSAEPVLRVWDVVSNTELGTPGAPPFSVSDVAFSPDGSAVASASFQTIHVWQAGTGKELRRLHGHRGGVRCLAFSSDGKTLASGGEDNTIRLWDVATGRQLGQLEGHRFAVAAVAFSPDGKTLASASWNHGIRFWDMTKGQELRQFQLPEERIYAFRFSSDSKKLTLVNGNQRELSLWEITEGKEFHQLSKHEDEVYTLALSQNGRILASGGPDGRIRLLETATGRELCQLRIPSSRITDSLCFSADGKNLASAAQDRSIRVWEVMTGKERLQLNGHQEPVIRMAFSPNGQRLVSGSGDTTLLVWDMTGGRLGPGNLSSQEQEAAWTCLADEDASAANQAIWSLIAARAQTVQFLRQRVQPVAAVDKQRIAQLINDLESNRFAERQKASQELALLGELAEPALRQAVLHSSSGEARQRAEHVLKNLDVIGTVKSPQRIRVLRAVEVLEHIGTLEAMQFSETLSKGAPEALFTREIKESLERLGKQSPIRE